MSDRRRRLGGLVLAAAGAVLAFNLGWLGLMVGVMGTDACGTGAVDDVAWWIVPGYPAALLIAALTPPWLYLRRARPLKVGLAFAGIGVVAVGWMLVWYFLVSARCA